MNSTPENKYERYVLPENWNLCQDKQIHVVTRYITCDSAINALKILYGNHDQDSNIYRMPQNWADNNEVIVLQWFQPHKLTDAHKLEIHLHKSLTTTAQEETDEDADD